MNDEVAQEEVLDELEGGLQKKSIMEGLMLTFSTLHFIQTTNPSPYSRKNISMEKRTIGPSIMISKNKMLACEILNEISIMIIP